MPFRSLSSKLLRNHDGEGWLYRHTEKMFVAMNTGYRWMLTRVLGAPIVVLAAGALDRAADPRRRRLLVRDAARAIEQACGLSSA